MELNSTDAIRGEDRLEFLGEGLDWVLDTNPIS